MGQKSRGQHSGYIGRDMNGKGQEGLAWGPGNRLHVDLGGEHAHAHLD